MKLVLKIGGSLLFGKNQEYNIPRFKKFADVIRQLKNNNHDLVLVIGGGILAKSLIEMGKLLGAEHDALDRLGIAATWVSAQLMITALSDIAYPMPIMTEQQLTSLQKNEKMLVLGGLRPGQSTNAVAAYAAEITNSKILINATDVEGVYDGDPKRSTKAKLLPELTLEKLREIVSSLESEPGTYPLFDKRALDTAKRAQIEVWFVNGSNPENLLLAIEERKIGTRVVPS
jgi:uridylate kinase